MAALPAYDFAASTEMNWALKTGSIVAGVQQHKARVQVDAAYHKKYRPERVRLQDNIVKRTLESASNTNSKQGGQRWLVFTAGSMGVGKGYSMEKLGNSILRLGNPIVADPDTLRTQLPEFLEYQTRNPLTAGLLTHKEAGLLSELVLEEGLRTGKSVVQDGSLKDPTYAKKLIERVRKEHPDIKIAVVHVTATKTQTLARALSRSRQIPLDLITESIERVPRSVQTLAPLVDTVLNVDNTGVVPKLADPLPELISQFRASAPSSFSQFDSSLRSSAFLHPFVIPLVLQSEKRSEED